MPLFVHVTERLGSQEGNGLAIDKCSTDVQVTEPSSPEPRGRGAGTRALGLQLAGAVPSMCPLVLGQCTILPPPPGGRPYPLPSLPFAPSSPLSIKWLAALTSVWIRVEIGIKAGEFLGSVLRWLLLKRYRQIIYQFKEETFLCFLHFFVLLLWEISFHTSQKLQLMLHFSNKVKNNALIFVPLHQKDVIKNSNFRICCLQIESLK